MNTISSIEAVMAARTTRRAAIKTLSIGALSLGVFGFGGVSTAEARTGKRKNIDADILNFALNLEYLEAEYYVRAITGKGIDDQGAESVEVTGTGAAGQVIIKNNPRVDFSGYGALAEYAEEIASDELAHVAFLRAALQGAGAEPVARPAIDLLNSFNAAAQAAGLGSAFDPFGDPISFLLGAFIFEDVGVTAYKGAAALITNRDILTAAAGILATEAYHASAIRTLIYQEGEATRDAAQKISDLRDAADGARNIDQGVVLDGSANLVPTNANGLVFSRSIKQVVNIVYLNADGQPGGFFPNGLNSAFVQGGVWKDSSPT